MIRRISHTLVLFVWFVVVGAPAFAQIADGRTVRRVEVDAGGGWFGGADAGAADANLRASDPAPRPLRLFGTDSRFAGAPAFHVRAGFAFTQRIGLEGGVTLSHPDLQTSVSGDLEGAPPITIAERVDQYVIDASVVVRLRRWSASARTVPFVAAGGGYLRQLHEGLTVVEEGRVYHAGGGVKHLLVIRRGPGLIRAAGLRADARLYVTSGGIAVEDGPRPHGAISGSVFVMF